MTIRLLTILLSLYAGCCYGRIHPPEALPPDSRDSAVRALRAEIARRIAPVMSGPSPKIH